MISKRSLLRLGVGATGLGLLALPVRTAPLAAPSIGMRGSIDAGKQGLRPDALSKGGDALSRKLQALITEAARQNMPLFLPPGRYAVSNLILPDGARLTGIAGATQLVYSGGGFLMRGEDAGRIELTGLTIDGGGRSLGADAPALVHLSGIGTVSIDACEIIGSQKTGIQLERCGGRIERSSISDAADYGIYAVESSGLSITGNSVSDCGNGGILVHRWTKGYDGTMVSGNRITGMGAMNGGTGQYGNGINLYRADGVTVSSNQISRSAFSAIRANSASNALISNNQCLQSGETSIYAEFAFEGALVSGNVVDGAANGISVVNFNEGGRLATVANNVVRNLSLTGPYVLEEAIFGVGISVEADTAVTGNVIENAPFWGLALGFGAYLRNVVATGNVVRQAGIGCAVSVAEGTGSAVISGNLFQGVSKGAIIGHRWKTAVTGELVGDDAAARYPQLTIEGNRIV